MGRESVVDALVRELDRALTSLRAAQRMAADLQRRPVGRPPSAERRLQRASEDLRYSGMTAAEAADALEVSEEYVRRLLRRGVLEGVPFGGRTGWRLSREYVLGIQRQIAASKEGKEIARRRLLGSSGSRKRASKKQARK